MTRGPCLKSPSFILSFLAMANTIKIIVVIATAVIEVAKTIGDMSK